MADLDFSKQVSLLNECSAQFLIAEEQDLAVLGSILAKLDELQEDMTLPEEMRSRLSSFVDDLGDRMLSLDLQEIIAQGPSLLSSLIRMIPDQTASPSPALLDLPPLTEAQILFARENIGVELEKLDQLEDQLLAAEQNGKEEHWAAVASILHSLKGDFGVLGLRSLGHVVHYTESVIASKTEQNRSSIIPALLSFRDLLVGKISEIQNGYFEDIPEGDIEKLFSASASVSEAEGPHLTLQLSVNAEPDLLAEFITESKEHIASAESALMDLETDRTNRDLIDAAFRSCHTVKGVAGFLNLKPIQELAHELENIMDAGRTGKLSLDSDILTLLLSGFDYLGELLELVEKLLPAGESAVNPEIQTVYSQLASVSASLVEKSVKKSAPVSVSEPKAEKTEPAPAAKVENVQKTPAAPSVPAVREPKQEDSVKKTSSSDDASVHGKVEETVRVSVNRLDRLIDSIGEIVIAQSLLTADPDFVKMKSRSVEQKATQISMVMRQIQEEAMSLRMVSLKSTFQKMNRLVRDLSQKIDKPVELIISGEDTELDKSITEHIGDPLVHMLRNSLDHGIESAEERLDAGKEPIGTVELRAYHKSGNVVIDIVDDGRGLNRQKLLKKAIENGIADPHREYSDQEVYQFIFAAGFSTAAEITDISGRGVGMDVVKRNILNMRGSLEIHSDEGKGTCFSIKLPLTMAIIDGMIVYAGGETLIIPTLSIVSTVSPKKEQLQTVRGKGEMINIHGQLYRFVRLSDLLGLDSDHREVTAGIAIILENIMGNRIALWVDGILKKQQVVIKSLGRLFKNYKWISGGAVLGDGKINLILDVNELFQMIEK